jgi:hypothetical protein
MKPYQSPPVITQLHGPLNTVALELKEYVSQVHTVPVPHPASSPTLPLTTPFHYVMDPTGQHVYSIVSRQYGVLEHLSVLAHEEFGWLHRYQGDVLVGPRVFGRFTPPGANPSEGIPEQGLLYLNSFDRQVTERIIVADTMLSVNLKHFQGNVGMDATIREMVKLMTEDFSGLLDQEFPLVQTAKLLMTTTLMREMFNVQYGLTDVFSSEVQLDGNVRVRTSDVTAKDMAADLRRLGFTDDLRSLVNLGRQVSTYYMGTLAYKNSFHGHNKILKMLVGVSEVVSKAAWSLRL